MHNEPVVPEPATSTFGVPLIRMLRLSDEDVIERLRQGHSDALPLLFHRFYRLVLKIAVRILRDPGEAEDVMQDVFFEILTKQLSLTPPKAVRKRGFCSMPTTGA